jgi:anaerobic magnesium-protoporphyrin IX monomethyl ester cyclase
VVAGALTLTGIDRVEAELRQLESAGVQNVVFIDDTFNVPLPRFKDLCRMMIRNRFSFSWFSYFRCSNSDDEAFALMKESGCAGVFLGIESADPGVLGHMNKAASPERYRYGIRKLKEYDVATFASLIIGFPGETIDSVSRTRDFVEEAGPTFYRAELYFHDPKTPIQQKAEALRIRGRGYGWRHASMDWMEACDHVDDLYRSIKNSIVLPLYMFDFWSLPYLRGQGVAMPTLVEFLRRAQQHLVGGLDEGAESARLSGLGDLFAGERVLAG